MFDLEKEDGNVIEAAIQFSLPNGQAYYLLVMPKNPCPFAPAQWSFPMGDARPGEYIFEAAERIINELTGLIVPFQQESPYINSDNHDLIYMRPAYAKREDGSEAHRIIFSLSTSFIPAEDEAELSKLLNEPLKLHDSLASYQWLPVRPPKTPSTYLKLDRWQQRIFALDFCEDYLEIGGFPVRSS